MKLDLQTQFNLNRKSIDIVGFLKRIQNSLTNRSLYKVIKKNDALVKQDNNSKQCFILGLGPSLKNVNINKIEGDTIVVNRFFKIGKEFPDFVPTFYMMVDNQFASSKNIDDFKTALDMYINKGTIYILNSKLSDLEFLKQYNSNNIFYISYFGGDFHPNTEYRIDRVLPAYGNVVCTAIGCSMLMGYKKISLLGCDFNSFASTIRNHCYEDKSKERMYRLSFELFAYSFEADTHDRLQSYAEKHGITIINATRGSLIDAYPKVDMPELYRD